jgi:hypothetical protein
MEEKIKLSPRYITGTLIMVAIGIVAMVVTFIQNPDRGWVNLLLNNFYFLSISIGAVFFLAIQRITQSGWSAGFIRVPEAMGAYLPIAALFFLILIFGVNSIYQWAHEGVAEHDALIAHKTPFLNLPFWSTRIIIYFSLWILLAWTIRKFSLREDTEGGMENFKKAEFYSKVFIFIVAITFTAAAIDWIMSIDVHWFSTIFAVKDFISGFHHASVIILLIVLILNKKGYFPFLNKKHLQDFSRYIFMLCIIWGYFWFSEFMLIWYGNIPEETAYFVPRVKGESWRFLFFANLIINWFLPFLILMPKATSQSKVVLMIMIPILIIGHYIDLYLQIFPGTLGERIIGFSEIGTFIGFAGLFMLAVGYALSRANLYPVNHPYLEESTSEDH